MDTVSIVAGIAGVTVRTLHHYDAIGLVRASERSSAGYRLYGSDDLDRLQSVLFYRELGFGLEEIGRIVDDPGFDRGAALRRQRRMLGARRSHTDRLIGAIDAALTALEEGRTMTADETLSAFGEFDPREHADEAEARWGHTEAYAESQRRTQSYTERDWDAIQAEVGEVAERLAALAARGADATGEAAMAAAERHRQHIDRWYYPCSLEIHVELAEMYVSDDRFRAWWEAFGPRLADYASAAIKANAVERA